MNSFIFFIALICFVLLVRQWLILSFAIKNQKPILLFSLFFFFSFFLFLFFPPPLIKMPAQMGFDLSSHCKAKLQSTLYHQIFLHIWKHLTTYKMSNFGSIPVTIFSKQLFVLTGRIDFPAMKVAHQYSWLCIDF